MFKLKDKNIVVTGASGGIGLEVVKTFIKLGANVLSVDASESVKKNIAKIKTKGQKNVAFRCDLTNEKDLKKLQKKVFDTFNKVDILVNCAGTNVRKKLVSYTNEDWDKIQNVNVKALFNISNMISKNMKKHKYGRIINIASIQSSTCWNGNGRFSLAPYGASKAAVVSLTKSFALDLAKHNITVNAICPAFVDTNLVRPLKEDKELFNDIVKRTPIGRFAKVEEIASSVVFLASDESSYITGHSLYVDGGWTIE